ncbi:MAG: hypothetical protein KDA42_09830 [Planctomycetales bacterium]|nr:hypothetical protein [Planctomycetales bacterium]
MMHLIVLSIRTLLVAAHLLSNALAGGGLLLAALAPGDPDARKQLARWSLWAIFVGLATGGLAVLVVLAGGYPGYGAAAARLPAGAYWMLAGEWLFTAVLVHVYFIGWRRLAHRRFWHGLVGVAAATNLLYHFPTMMIVLARLAHEPALSHSQTIARPEFLALLRQPFPLAKSFHFWALSLVVAGVAYLFATDRSKSRSTGAAVALAGVMLLVLSGVGQLVAAPAGVSRELMSLSSMAGWFFLGGLLCGLGLIGDLSYTAARGAPGQRRLIVVLVLAAVLMSAATVSVR